MKIARKIWKNYFLNIKKDLFKWIAIIGSFTGDLSFIIFVRNIIFKPENLMTYIERTMPQSLQSFIHNIPENQRDNALKMMSINLDIIISLWLLLAVFSYFLFHKDKKWGINFIKNGTALFGVIFSFVTFFEALQFSVPWAIYFLSLTPMYVFLYCGMEYFYPKKPKTSE